MPVNADGTGWHQSHAFGDFCYICHAGNNQAKDEAAAHEGMVPPLSDVRAACQQCHVADLDARAAGVRGSAFWAWRSARGLRLSSYGVVRCGSRQRFRCAPLRHPTNAMRSWWMIRMCQLCPELRCDRAGEEANQLGQHDPDRHDRLDVVGGGGFVVTREKLVNVKFGDTRKPWMTNIPPMWWRCCRRSRGSSGYAQVVEERFGKQKSGQGPRPDGRCHKKG
jgi:hypothetical protein